MKEQPKSVCPVCQSELKLVRGQVLDPTDGFSLYCNNPNCTAQEVMGHGKNEKEAFEVITEKFKRKPITTE